MSDNRRRIKPELLDEIEEYEGDTFTEQLLNWNRKQDTTSTENLDLQDIETAVTNVVENLRINNHGGIELE